MRVLFVNRYFHPDISATSQLLSDLAFHLARELGVVVITSRQRYEDPRERLPPVERVAGLLVHRVWTSHFGRASLAGRALDYASFYASATFRLFLETRRGDVVVALTDPPVISVVAFVVTRLRGARLVNWLQDVFPETAAALELRVARGAFGNVVKWLRDKSLAGAAANVVLSESMAATIVGRGVARDHVRIIHNWSPGTEIKPLAAEHNPLRKEWDFDGRFVVGYSGNMGRAHDLEILLKAAERLRPRRDIAFLFIGAGNQKSALEQLAREAGLPNVVFRPYQPRSALPRSLSVPDCHVVSLKPALEGLVFPSKLYSSLASGRPVIFIGARDGEVCRMISEGEPFGFCVDPTDDAGLARTIAELCDNPEQKSRMGRNARALFERRFVASIALADWTALLTRL